MTVCPAAEKGPEMIKPTTIAASRARRAHTSIIRDIASSASVSRGAGAVPAVALCRNQAAVRGVRKWRQKTAGAAAARAHPPCGELRGTLLRWRKCNGRRRGREKKPRKSTGFLRYLDCEGGGMTLSRVTR